MKGQLQRLGISYAWERELATCDAEYYKWNQWLFIRMFEKGLAYRRKSSVNWCPVDKTVLANEQVVDGGCWRCGTPVETRDLEQWFFRITAYADELLDGGRRPEQVAREGADDAAQLDRALRGRPRQVRARRRPVDADRGLHHPHRHDLRRHVRGAGPGASAGARRSPSARATAALRKQVQAFRLQDRRARISGELEKQGVRHRVSRDQPVHARAGARVGRQLRARRLRHGRRSWPCRRTTSATSSSRRKYGLPIRPVVVEPPTVAWTAGQSTAATETRMARHGPSDAVRHVSVDSGEFSGLPTEEAQKRMIAAARSSGIGEGTVQYRLKDWGISRQRYWGTPIPMVVCPTDGIVPVPDDQLPVELPTHRAVHRPRRFAAGAGAGVREHDVPDLRRARAPRDRHHGHLRGLVLVLLPVRRSAEREAGRSIRRP